MKTEKWSIGADIGGTHITCALVDSANGTLVETGMARATFDHDAPADTIRQQVRNLIEKFGPHPGHVFNLGHGIHQTVEPDHLKILVDAVHEFGREIRR